MDLGVECYDTLLKKPNHILQLIPFNSNRKRASTAVEVPGEDKVRVFCKGGPEVVFKYVSEIIDTNGNRIKLTEGKKEEIMKKIVIDTFAKKAFRTLLVAYSEFSIDEYKRLEAANNQFASESDREVLE